MVDNKMEATNLKCTARWISESIDISSNADVSISIDLSEVGAMESSDYIAAYYVLDNGSEMQFDKNGYMSDDFTFITASQESLNGDSLRIIVEVTNDYSLESHYIDSIIVLGYPLQNTCDIYLEPDSTTLYTLFVKDSITRCTSIDSFNVKVSLSSSEIIASGPLDFCTGDSVTLTASDASSYQWSTGATSKSITVQSSGNYWLNYYDSTSGCFFRSDTLLVKTRTTPNVSFIQTPNGFTVHFTDQSAPVTGWLWGFGDGATDTIPNPKHFYKDTGVYVVSLTVYNGMCSNSTTRQVYISTDIRAACINQPQNVVGADIKADNNNGYFYVAGKTLPFPYRSYVAKYKPNMDTAWTRTYTNGNQSDYATSVDVDKTGNVYVAEISDFYEPTLLKYNANGTFQWKMAYANGESFMTKVIVKIDNQDNVYFLRCNWDQSISSHPLITDKYDPNGNLIWTRGYNYSGSTTTHYPIAAELDSANNIFIVGTSYGNSDNDIVTLKYDASGTLLWSKRFNNGEEKAVDVAVDVSGNVFALGTTIVGGNENIVVVKYDNSGNQQWVYSYDGVQNNNDYAAGIEVDANGNAYIGGTTYGLYPTFGWLAIKLNPSGGVVWKQEYDSENEYVNDVGMDQYGNFFLAGGRKWSGYEMYFLLKYDSNGDIVWSNHYTTTAYGGVINAIDLDQNGAAYVTGSWSNNECYTIRYGKDTALSIKNIDATLIGKSIIYPNPFTTSATIQLINTTYPFKSIRIYSLNGRLIREDRSINQNAYTLFRNDLPPGMYFVEVIDKKGQISRQKVVVQ